MQIGVNLKKTLFLILPFIAGLLLFVHAWFTSYPISIDYSGDFVFYHISISYWISIPLLLTSMCLIAFTTKKDYLKWLLSLGIVLVLYSLVFFYFSIPTSDSQYFRGLTEYFSSTKDLNPLISRHAYYQWPSFFLLSAIISSITGLSLMTFEFVLYIVIIFLLATGLYVYTSKIFKKGGFLSVIAFFVVMLGFVEIQAVPFSLAFALLLLIFNLETKPRTSSTFLVLCLLIISITLTHAFIPLFFMVYSLLRSIFDRKKYLSLLFFSLVSYFLIQVTIARLSIARNILQVISFNSEMPSLIESTLTPILIPFDVIAQTFSRTVIITLAAICVLGFVIMVLKRKVRSVDLTLFLTGLFYFGSGIFFYTLGYRALILLMVPISLGVAYLFDRPRRLIKYGFVILITVLLIFSTFIIIHRSFSDRIFYQTQKTYNTANFIIERYNWGKPTYLLADYRTTRYLETKLSISPNFLNYWDEIKKADVILYTLGLETELLDGNYSLETILPKINVFYNNGYSYVVTNPNK